MKDFVTWLENWGDDEGPEMEGEYWIDGEGNVSEAELGDETHVSHVMKTVQSQICDEVGYNDFDDDWEDAKEKIAEKAFEEKYDEAIAKSDQEEADRLEKEFNYDPEQFFNEKMIEENVDDEKLAIAEGFGDARDYAMKHWGWKRVQDHNIETWTLDVHDIHTILEGIFEIVGQLQEGDAEKLEVYINLHSNGKSYDLTVAQLEAMVAPKTPQMPHPSQQPVKPQQPPVDPTIQQQQVARDRMQADINQQSQAANKHQIDQDLINMPDYYKNKKHPFADWTFRNFGKILYKEGLKEEPEIIGQYWIDKTGHSIKAHDDMGNLNHDKLVIQTIQSNIADKFGYVGYVDDSYWHSLKAFIAETFFDRKYGEVVATGDKEEEQRLVSLFNNEDYYPLVEEAMQEAGFSKEKLKLANGQGDAREYAIKLWGWKRVDEHRIDTWYFAAADIRAIIRGTQEIMEQLKDEDAEKVNFSIYILSNRKSYDLTLAQLEAMITPKPQQPPVDPTIQQQQVARDRMQADINQQSQAANKHQIDQDLINMPDYYRNKKHPFADWTFKNFGKIL